jgi:hypothetical protein
LENNNIQTERDRFSSNSNPHLSGDFINQTRVSRKTNSKKGSSPKTVQPATITEAPVDEEELHDTKNELEQQNLMYNDNIRQSIQVGSFEEVEHSGGLI